MELVDVSFLLAIAEWVWGADPSEEVTPEICLGSVPFLSSGCLSILVVKALGVAIILGSCLNKAPIMFNVIKAKSCAGLSLSGFYGELIIYSNAAFYGFLNGHPISAYGENVALGTQTIALIILTWKLQDDPVVPVQQRIVAVLVFAAYCYGCLALLPQDMYYLLMASIWPVLVYARGSQILKTFQVKHTGAQSIVTLTTNLVGGLIRIATTIKEVGWDMNVLNGYLLSVTSNFILFLQYWIYLDNTKKFVAELDKKKKA